MGGRHTVEPLVVLQPIQVDTGSPDREGRLVMAEGLLIAILVRLDAPDHERAVGRWFLEVGLGRLHGQRPPPFDTLEAAARWLRRTLKAPSAAHP